MSDTDSDTASSVGSIVEDASEPDTTSFKDLFSDRQWSRVSDMVAHNKAEHGFDLTATIKGLGSDADEITTIKLINYLRSEAQKGTDPKSIKVTLDDLSSDKYLQPVLEDDALLFELGELMPNDDINALDYDEYEAKLHKDMPEDFSKVKLTNDRDQDYFESYKGNSIHREMIEDRVRTEGYRDFIEKNADVFAGKTVLDVGCGTGILSLFCARAGAKKVFAVDNSGIAVRAKEIIAKNGYQDRIELIQGRAEDFNTQRLIGKEKVDIIISEWMGYGLLFEGMLDSVLRARDMYLKPDGIMVPSHCNIRLAPISDTDWIADSTSEKFWKDIYGFDFSPMIPGGLLNTHEIGVFDVPEKALCGSANSHLLEMKTVSVQDLSFKIPLRMMLDRDITSLEAIAIWFDTIFIHPGSTQDVKTLDNVDWGKNGIPGLGFSTGPSNTPTHWHQAVLLLDKEVAEKQAYKKGSVLEGTLTYAKEKGDDRGITVTVEWKGKGEQGDVEGRISKGCTVTTFYVDRARELQSSQEPQVSHVAPQNTESLSRQCERVQGIIDLLRSRPSSKNVAATAYISGNALIVLDRPNHVLQTLYIDEEFELEAVAIDEGTGKLAVCSTRHIYIYRPYGQDEGAIKVGKWSLQGSMSLPDNDDSITTLSWGMPDELLAGSASLTLFNTHADIERIWTKHLANPVKFAHFSPDAELIASTGRYDRLLKIWRRTSFGSADQSFDYFYLPHPKAITGLHWRHPYHKEQSADNVLYTICADNKVRVWVPGEHHGVDGMHMWAEVDLIESIMERHVPLDQQSKKRYAFFIDGKHFTHAAERAMQQASPEEKDHGIALHHLIEVANRNPEICVVLDDRGNMSAWGFENVGAKVKKITDVFNIAHVDSLHMHFAKEPQPVEDNVQFYAFIGDKPESELTILSHHFDGRIEWLESRIDYLFDPSSQPQRIQRKAMWTGHSHAIKKVNRTASGKALVSRTTTDECIVWIQRQSDNGMTLHRHSSVKVTEHIHRTALLQEGNFVVFLHHNDISLWDTRGREGVQVMRRSYELQGKPLCLLVIPEIEPGGKRVHIATVSSEMNGICWEITLPTLDRDSVTGHKLSATPYTNGYTTGHQDILLKHFSTFDLGSGDNLAFVLPVDPAGSAPAISGFLDTFARDIAVSYSNSGVIKSWTARVNLEERNLEWLSTSEVDTGVGSPSLASGTSIRKAALVDAEQTTLTIWNTRSAQLEHQEKFEGNGIISDLDWSSTPDNQSILAVGFPHRVVIYAQLRYDYLNAGPSWVKIRDVRIRDITPHPIGDSVWLGSGNLVIGAGNQLFIQDEHVQISESLFPSLRTISRKTASIDIFDAVSRLNGPLPAYHPQLLSQCVLAGKLLLVQRILIRLYAKLKFWIEGEDLDSTLGFMPEDFSENEAQMTSSRKEIISSYAEYSSDTEPEAVTEEVASDLKELLTKKQIPLLSSREQFRLADIIECIGMVEKHRRSIDENAGRFLLFFRQHVLNEVHKGPISWREIIWAFHSGSQDILVDLVSRHFSGKMLWQHAKECGVFMWMSDTNALRAQFEVIARNEYTKTEEKNPVDCALYYIALRKKPVLVGLWRMATWSREQAATHRLLSNNFNEERWKTAALKNAYALMGRRRFEYAASFFLLADHLHDAVSVLHNQLGDTQLAIAVARVYGGDDSPVLLDFLKNKILPQAAREGNRWLAIWAYWLLNRKDMAVRALVTPLSDLLDVPEITNPLAKSYLTDDPALVVLYKQLREKSLQTLRGATMVGLREEWDFVLHTAGLYDRMGCDVLALDLVKTWEFLLPPPPTKSSLERPSLNPTMPRESSDTPGRNASATDFDFDPRKLLRRRSSLVVADLPIREHKHNDLAESKGTLEEDQEGEDAGSGEDEDKEEDEEDEKRKEEPKKPPPTQFNEPDANSLLDAFGF
ncbi:wd repeat-containing protein [Stemphylium lycopersici]|nr:wd repeat-containing protein [Stemphylium lycopersici]